MPGSQTTRGGTDPRAIASAPVAFCCHDGIGTPDYIASPLTTWPTHTPVNASRDASRRNAHDSGPVWVATPSP